ncbi:MAG: GntR family transcriptional regulator [Gemmatimonadota bacterium]
MTDQAYGELEERIVTLQLEPGAVLSEATLAKQLGFGRTPIREALQRLAREGLVVIFPRRGILVSEIDVKRQLMLLEVRRELERLMATKATQRTSDAEQERFVAIAQGMEQASVDNDDITFMRLDRELNLLVASAARNEFASRAMGLMHGLSRRFWYFHYKEVADLPLCAKLHADLARAIYQRDAEKAVAASDQLMDYIEDFTRASLDAMSSTRASVPFR